MKHALITRFSKTVFHLYISIFTIDLLSQKTPFVFEFINNHCYVTGGRSSIHFANFYNHSGNFKETEESEEGRQK